MTTEPRIWSDEPEVVSFLHRARMLCPAPQFVVELGSYAMHDHDPRALWPGVRWTGIDSRPGPGVDRVGLAHHLLPALADERAPDLVLSVSALEHDPHWGATIRAAVMALRPGAVFAATWAGPGWEPHEPDATPDPGWYRNVSVAEALHAVASTSASIALSFVEAWYVQRTMSPPVPRACLLVQAGPWLAT